MYIYQSEINKWNEFTGKTEGVLTRLVEKVRGLQQNLDEFKHEVLMNRSVNTWEENTKYEEKVQNKEKEWMEQSIYNTFIAYVKDKMEEINENLI